VDAPERRLRKGYLDLSDGQLHCHHVAGQEPAIVFLHQTASAAGTYDALLAELRLPNRLVAMDTPGFGGSFDPPGNPTMEDYARWILEGLDALGIDAFHLFGHHTGANLAIEIALRHPDRARSVMLAGPAFMTDEERTDFLRDYSEPIRPTRDGMHLIENWRYAAVYNPDCDVETLHREVTFMLRAWRGRAQAYRAVGSHDAIARARILRCPALLLTSPDDFFHSGMDRARAILPDASLAVTAGGNFQPAADPTGVARAIEVFLQTISAHGQPAR